MFRRLGFFHEVLTEAREVPVAAEPGAVFEAICRRGRGQGWPGVNWLRRIRGVLDRLVGGLGLGRGRRHPRETRVGDALDFRRARRTGTVSGRGAGSG